MTTTTAGKAHVATTSLEPSADPALEAETAETAETEEAGCHTEGQLCGGDEDCCVGQY